MHFVGSGVGFMAMHAIGGERRCGRLGDAGRQARRDGRNAVLVRKSALPIAERRRRSPPQRTAAAPVQSVPENRKGALAADVPARGPLGFRRGIRSLFVSSSIRMAPEVVRRHSYGKYDGGSP